ncbi:MAG: diaminopimelate decarboxylase [Dehalococcoidales bacterium]|nr:diaminopimelate decarboxylase [Dehalococcoidales bacterium]
MIPRISLFPLTTEISKDGHLVIGGCDTIALANEYGTPLYLFDEHTLRSMCREFKSEFGQRHEEVMVIFASKAFLNRAVANIFKEEGIGLDVVSAGEFSIAKSVDFPADMIYLHGNNKSVDELRMALKNHIARIVIDSFDELKLLAKLAEESGHIPDILLRITPGIDPHTHKHITTGTVGSKFGFPLFDADRAVSQALATASLNLIGLHCHIGSLITETQPYVETIEVMLDFADKMNKKYGFELEELDIGGGFPVRYTVNSPNIKISQFAEAIISRLISKCNALDMPLPSLTIEPGRAMVARSGVALYRVGMTKNISELKHYVSVDGGMADNIRPALYGAEYEAILANKASDEDTEPVTVAGKFCESADILIQEIKLPPVIAGDIIAVPVCGAYCVPMSSNYNASLKPIIVMVKEGKARIIRKREILQDLIRNDLL